MSDSLVDEFGRFYERAVERMSSEQKLLQELRGEQEPAWFTSHPLVIAQRAGPQTMGEWYGEIFE